MSKLHPFLGMARDTSLEPAPGAPAKAKTARPLPHALTEATPEPVRARAKPAARPVAKRDAFALPEFDVAALAERLPRKRRQRRSIGLWTSFFLMVALPTLAAGLYYGLIVSNQYLSEFRFAVRSQDFAPAGASAASTALGAAARAGGYTDNFLVVDYLTSRQAVEDLSKTLDLRAMFDRPGVDILSRLSGDDTMENLVSYWQSMIDASFDLATGLALVRVRAFTPDDAYTIAATLVKQSEKLINEISARARIDAVRFAESDVSRAEQRLRDARGALRQFRDTEQTPDAARTAGGTLDLAMKLRGELAGLQSQLSSLRTYMDPNAPTVKVLESRIAATAKQITAIEREIGKGNREVANREVGGREVQAPAAQAGTAGAATAAAPATGSTMPGAAPVLSDVLSNYEDVDLSRQFAEKYYDTTLSALELARSEAAAQQTYVATYVQPARAQASLYPQRLMTTLIIFLAAGALWFVSVMVFFSIRDHVA
ncbi:hypothetical protein [Ancylobacter amanitiformis]|uniref:Capsular polysaccharide transport system permease protein n=1 Tax=Ancylobacter amanitiformis TaxID=217069 RepID=A0ABU0LV38_9HYPH|nr:hypothetical protein [Ancylobacter amanitiformis]MDQ0512529.1 capsular polysaccharide transport system permease protein [Ancylobacter amanitiformis]